MYAKERRSTTEGSQGCAPWSTVHPVTTEGRILLPEVSYVVKILDPSGPEGGTFGGPGGAELAWELVCLPSG